MNLPIQVDRGRSRSRSTREDSGRARSCPTASFCVAVDSNGDVLTYSRAGWSPPLGIDTAAGGLVSVSCPTASFCSAVDLHGYVVIFNGMQWLSPLNVDPSGGGAPLSCVRRLGFV